MMDRRHPCKSSPRPLVLIVDGQQDTWELYAVALPPPGFDVMAVDDSAEACSRAARPTVSLVRRSVESREKLYRRGQRATRRAVGLLHLCEGLRDLPVPTAHASSASSQSSRVGDDLWFDLAPPRPFVYRDRTRKLRPSTWIASGIHASGVPPSSAWSRRSILAR